MNLLTEQQKQAVESIDFHVLVSAGAGSGKTHVLVERYLEILRQKPELKVSNLVAVTYTKKAAGEMRTRLKSRLEELIAGCSSEQERQHWSSCRIDIDQARIGTIHSLCESILKSFPVQAGVDPKFEVLEDLERAEILRQSIDRTLLEAAALPGAGQELLRAYPVDQVRLWLSSFLKSPIQVRESMDCLGTMSDEELSVHADKLLTRLQTRIVSELLSDATWNSCLSYLHNQRLDPANKLEAMRLNVINMGQRLQSETGLSAGEKVLLLRQMQGQINLKVGGNSPDVKPIKEALRQLRETIQDRVEKLPEGPGESDTLAYTHIRALATLFQQASRIYQEIKHREQKLDFNDLIAASFQLLMQPGSAARRYYNQEIQAILVDEFQDTNATQSQILTLLAGADTRLFLIGDDKQSIYDFQGADVSLFNQTRHRFSAANGSTSNWPGQISGPTRVEQLSQSFRSHSGIVNFVNAVFEQLLEPEQPLEAYRACHQPLRPSRADDPHSTRIDVIRILTQKQMEAEEQLPALELEARAVAAWIEQKIQEQAPVFDKRSGGWRPIAYGDFAILVQRNDDFAPLEPWLAERSIPYTTMGGSGFLSQQEIYDLENFLRFLGSTQDSQALFGVLRSPLLGVTDDVIHTAAVGKSFGLWACIQAIAAEQGPGWEMLQPAVALLKELLPMAGYLPLDELLRKIIADTKYDTILMGLPNGRQKSRNVWKLVYLAARHAQLSPLEFCNSLNSMRELKVKQSAAPVDSGDSVRLMTIHASKGLEFPAVVLPALGQDASRLWGKLLFHREYGIAFDTTRDKAEDKPSLFRAASLLKKDMSIAEKKRLLYVAMTRARDYLGIFLSTQAPARESFQSWLESALKLNPSQPGQQFKGRLKDAAYLSWDLDQDSVLDWQRKLKEQTKAAQPEKPILKLDLLQPIGQLEPSTHRRIRSYRVTPPAELSIAPALLGNYFHALMERIANCLERPGERVMMDVAVSQLGLVHPDIIALVMEDGKRLLDLFFASPLFQLMSSARRRLHEHPYAIMSGQQLEIHRTDLLVQDEQGYWHVIDYKTDHFTAEEIADKVKEHQSQLQHYVQDITNLTGMKPAAAIYFARLGELVDVSF